MSEAAWDEAGRLLARRPRSVAELREALAVRGHAVEAIDDAVARLTARGWLDDRRFAFDYAVESASRRGRGKERVLAELERRGVARRTAEAAWDEAVASGTVDPEVELERQLARRLGGRTGLGEREGRRVYNALLRAGFDECSIRRLLEPHLDRSCRTGAGDPSA